MPAILKGFLNRVLTPGFAFSYKKDTFLKKFGIPKGLLNKKAIVFITSGGKRWEYLIVGNTPKIMMKYFTLWFCGIKSKIYQIFNCRKLTDGKRDKIKRNIKKGLEWLE